MMSLYTSLVSPPQAVSGSLRTLCRDVSNAENLVISEEQRLFVTAREGVYELLGGSGGVCEKKLIPVRVNDLPRSFLKNGIAAHGNYLYLACAHVHQSDNPLLKAIMDDVNNVEQTSMGLLQIYLAAFTFHAESWIVRCDLRKTPAAFTDVLGSLPDNVLANGIAIDTQRRCLYVANSGPSLTPGKQRREFALQQIGVAEVQLNQPTQMRHAVDVDAVAEQACPCAFDMCDRRLHANLIGDFVQRHAEGSRNSQRQFCVSGETQQRALQGQVQHLHRKRLGTENQLRWRSKGDAGIVASFVVHGSCLGEFEFYLLRMLPQSTLWSCN
jgi:hypothetical protein